MSWTKLFRLPCKNKKISWDKNTSQLLMHKNRSKLGRRFFHSNCHSTWNEKKIKKEKKRVDLQEGLCAPGRYHEYNAYNGGRLIFFFSCHRCLKISWFIQRGVKDTVTWMRRIGAKSSFRFFIHHPHVWMCRYLKK